ncbi:MAG: VWA domain-containing protein, partial [Candidatus Hodarchaeota archaeon]
MKIRGFWLFLILIVSIFPQISVLGELEENLSLRGFEFSYTDDFTNQPENATTKDQITNFGNILGNLASRELNYGFNGPSTIIDLPVAIFEQGINAHGGYRYMDFDPYFLGNTFSGSRHSLTEPEVVAAHEFFHVIQYEYGEDVGIDFPEGDDWIIEGQARMIQDKIYIELDEQDGTDVASYFAEVNAYLSNPTWALMDLSYSAALWWTYVTEQYGTISTEPDYGLDAIYEWWEAVESIGSMDDPISVFNLMLARLGHPFPFVNFKEVFKDYIVSLYAKDLNGSDVPEKYKYKDETQTPGSYYPVSPTIDTSLSDGESKVGTDFIEAWSPRYYVVKPSLTKPGTIIDVRVNQITSNVLFYDLLEIKNGNIIKETRITGEDFSRSLVSDADTLVLVVGGLDNKPTDVAKYIWSFSTGSGLSVDIQSPDNNKQAFVGNPSNPEKFLAVAEIISSAAHVTGLSRDDFNIKVGSKNATVLTSTYIKGLYFLEIQAPLQATVDAYDLELTLADASDVHVMAVNYTDITTDTCIVLDRSGSMANDEKIDAAQAAARLFVNSFVGSDLIALLQYSNISEVLTHLEKVDLVRTEILNAIDGIIPSGFTSIGAALLGAQNELYTNGLTQNRHIIILTDGKENWAPYVRDVWTNVFYNSTQLHVVLLGKDAEPGGLDNLIFRDDDLYFAFDPSSGTLSSKLAEIYRSIAANIQGESRVFSRLRLNSGTWSIGEEFNLDQAKSATVTISYNSSTSLPNTFLRLQLPNTTQIPATFHREKKCSSSNNYYGHYIFKITTPPEGKYTLLSASSKTGIIEYYAEAAVQGSISTHLYFGSNMTDRLVGEEIPILVSLADERGPIHDAEVIANVTTGTGYNDLHTWQLHLYDDGGHNDGFANDGIYGNNFTRTKLDGSYIVSIHINGHSDTAGNFTREASRTFFILEGIKFDTDMDGLPNGWEERYGLDPLSSSGNDGANGDPDMDGLNNIDELWHGTSPKNMDTDRGGESDLSEVINGRDPYYEGDDIINSPYLKGSPGNQQVTLFFSVQPSYNSLSLFRSEINSTSGFSLVTSGISPNGEHIDTGLVNGRTYYYKLVATGASGLVSGFSNVVSATPNTDVDHPRGTVIINNGDRYTDSLKAYLTIRASNDTKWMRISQDPTFDGVPWVTFKESALITLKGTGLQLVCVQFEDEHNNIGAGEDGSGSWYTIDGIIVNATSIWPTTIPVSFSGIIFSFTTILFVATIVLLRRKYR